MVSASSIDFPGQARLLELMDNRDGTLSLFGTLVDHDAPVAPPPSGTPAASMSDTQLASLARALAANNVVTKFGARRRAGAAATATWSCCCATRGGWRAPRR